ncbi:hypothetical protein WKI65_31640 [Streptomyces sp. MS1.AVA.3]|uniref:hypothetical protein n=1 Tax=Streptomyces decoyicus TaxID=249567 RepID=UPI0030BB6DCD
MSVATADHQGSWALDDILFLTEDARSRIELVGGSLVMSPSPGSPTSVPPTAWPPCYVLTIRS